VQQSPRWMIRSGISLIFGFLILLLAGSWFFRYPDLVEAKITIMPSHNPIQIEMLQSGIKIPDSGQPVQPIGKIILSLKESHKVTKGQKVNIRLEDYPSMEYGILIGTVKRISTYPENGNYEVEVELPQNLKTNYNTAINLNQEMAGSAEIITENLRLIQRFIKPVKSLLK
ncbi:MAG: HlyD family efflux transporter periplasmic adaptor subunit, partial [Bacteroidota bacterium]|nr:HlyD family efflux transporter periplasmic adaptor subunit [Bacteroidota bacterium]